MTKTLNRQVVVGYTHYYDVDDDDDDVTEESDDLLLALDKDLAARTNKSKAIHKATAASIIHRRSCSVSPFSVRVFDPIGSETRT